MSPPETPLLAGSPIRSSHSPEPSYIPQVAITASTRAATSGETTWSRVTGLSPPYARVAAIVARSRAVTRTAHWRKYRSTARTGSTGMVPVARIR